MLLKMKKPPVKGGCFYWVFTTFGIHYCYLLNPTVLTVDEMDSKNDIMPPES